MYTSFHETGVVRGCNLARIDVIEYSVSNNTQWIEENSEMNYNFRWIQMPESTNTTIRNKTRPIAISRVLSVQKYSQKCTEVSQKGPLSHR